MTNRGGARHLPWIAKFRASVTVVGKAAVNIGDFATVA
jgi:hypothetical protein